MIFNDKLKQVKNEMMNEIKMLKESTCIDEI